MKISYKKFTYLFIFVMPLMVYAQWEPFLKPARYYGSPIADGDQSFFIRGIETSLLFSQDYGQSFVEVTEGLSQYPMIRHIEILPEYTLMADFNSNTLLKKLPASLSWEPYGSSISNHSFVRVNRINGKLLAITNTADRAHVFQSLDEGTTWTASESGLPNNFGGWDHFVSDTVAVVTHETGGAYFSVNGGDNWELAAGGANVHWFVNYTPWLIMARDINYDLIFSSDGGQSWVVPDGLPHIWGVSSMARVDSTIFALTYPSTESSTAFYKSNDNGSSWQSVENLYITGDEVGSLVASENGTLIVFADQKVYISLDSGLSWSITLEAPQINQPTLGNTNSFTYLIGDGGLFVSEDEGLTWVNRTLSLPIEDFSVLPILVKDSITLGADYHNIFRNTEENLVTTKIPVSNITDFVHTPDGIFASSAQTGGTVLYKSVDSGISWEPVSGITNNSGLLTLLEVDDKIFAAGRNKSIYVSENGGDSWLLSVSGITPDPSDWITALAYDNISGKLYAAVYRGELYESDNFGESWSYVDDFNCRNVVAGGGSVYVLALDENYNAQVFYSHDGGTTWELSVLPGPQTLQDGPMLLYGDNVLVGTHENNVMLSSDKGISWQIYNGGLPSRTIDFVQDGDFIYTSLRDEGIYRLPIEILPVSQKELPSISARIFPNPSVNGIFYLELKDRFNDSQYLEVIDVNGKKLMQKRITSEVTEIDLSHFPSGGIYWASLLSSDYKWVQSLIIK